MGSFSIRFHNILINRLALILALSSLAWTQDGNTHVERETLPMLIKPDLPERLQLEIITLQEEIVRLTICLKHHLTLNQCGAWRNGQVMQMPESTSQSANAAESPAENSEKSAKPKEQDKEKATH